MTTREALAAALHGARVGCVPQSIAPCNPTAHTSAARDVFAALPADEATPITDEQAERWLRDNDLYAVTHLHEPPPDCAECRFVR